MKLEDKNWCFACGKNNPIGLKLEFTKTPAGVKTIFVPARDHEGYKDIVHGGILATLLDEALAWACISAGEKVMTVSLDLKFRKPALIDELIQVEAKITQNLRKIIYGKALLKTRGNQILE